MLATERFLLAVYPALQYEKGLLAFQTQEFNLRAGVPFYVHLKQCHPGSGVPAGGQQPLQEPCPGPMQPDSTNFLTAYVDSFSSRVPIFHFGAGGDFIDAKLRVLRAEIRRHSEWDSRQISEAFLHMQLQFGPDNREGFLRQVPRQAIYKFSGCRLDLTRATFVTSVSGESGESGMEWTIPGTRRVRGRENCSATFEPFEGRLLALR